MAESSQERSSRRWHYVGIVLGALFCAVGLSGMIGLAGVGIAVLAAIIAYTGSAPFGIGVLHLGALLSEGFPEILPLVILETGAIVFILTDHDRFNNWSLTIAFIAGTVVFAIPFVFVGDSNGTLVAAIVFTTIVGFLSYGLHRYERLRLGLITEGPS